MLNANAGTKGEAHILYLKNQKNCNSSELGVLSTTANSNLGSVDTGAVGAVREEQQQDFDQNQDFDRKTSMIIKTYI